MTHVVQTLSNEFGDLQKELTEIYSEYDGAIGEVCGSEEEWQIYRRRQTFLKDQVRNRIQGWFLSRMAPFLKKVDREMGQDGFDPHEREHFAALQAMCVVLPQNPKDIQNAIRGTAEYFGHLQSKEKDERITADSIAEAFAGLARRASEKKAKIIASEVIDDAPSERT